MKGKIIVCFLMLLYHTASSQQLSEIDSLKMRLQKMDLSSDEKIEIYERLYNLYCTNDMEQSYFYSRSSLDLALEKNNLPKQATAYVNLGAVYDVRGNFDSAMYCYNKANELAIQLKDKELEGFTYRMHTFTNFRQGNYVLALQSCMKVLKHYQDMDNIVPIIGSLGCIGEIYQILGNSDRALYYTKQSLEMAEEGEHYFFTMQLYNIMGSIYIDMENYDEALKYKELALKTSEHGNNQLNTCVSLQGLARIWLELKDTDRALEYALQAVSIAREVGDPTILVSSLNILSNIYREQKQYHKCESAASEAWQTDSTYMDLAPNLAYNIALSNVYLKNKEKVIHFLKKSEELNKGRVGRNIHQALLEMEVKNESEKNEIRISSLEKEKDLNRRLNIASVAILCLLSGLFLFLLRFISQKRRFAEQQIKHLEQEKQLIATQSLLDGETMERKRLARDLHDGLGGILTVTKLRLKELESLCVEEGVVSYRFTRTFGALDTAIKELRRVAHHLMPESLMLSGLKISIEDLCKAIPGTYFHYMGNDKRLENYLEIMIYRCVYELVNNALKHAKANMINIQLIAEERFVSLTVKDNGVGFDLGNITPGAGLENIKDRIKAYNGLFNVYTSPQGGTEVTIEIELSS